MYDYNLLFLLFINLKYIQKMLTTQTDGFQMVSQRLKKAQKMPSCSNEDIYQLKLLFGSIVKE